MTSVQNLRLPLSGNKTLVFILLLAFGLSSCDMFKKAQSNDTVEEDKTELDEVQGTGKYNPETGEFEHSTSVNSEVDTVKWTTDPDVVPPISSEETDIANPNSGDPFDPKNENRPEGKLDAYNISVLLPFFSNRFSEGTSVDKASISAISFYGGMKIAFEELQRKGVNLNVNVHDTKGSESTTSALMESSSVASSDLIIGPFRKNNIKAAGEQAKLLKTPFVSPLSASSGVAKDNPYFIQVKPYLPTHCEAITQHVRERFDIDQVTLIARNKKAEMSRFDYFQNENKKIEGSVGATRFKEYVISGTEELNFDEIDITPYIKEGDTTVFIVPSFSNKNFIYGLLLQIYNTKGDNPVVIYGMPQWMDFEPPSFDYYELLNLHVSSANFVDPNDQNVKNFKRKYFDRFGTLPGDKAFSGYDIMMYFGKMIDKHGTKFQEKIDVEKDEYLNTKFEFAREVPLSAALQEDFSKTNLYENKHVYILKFEDFQFKNAD